MTDIQSEIDALPKRPPKRYTPDDGYTLAAEVSFYRARLAIAERLLAAAFVDPEGTLHTNCCDYGAFLCPGHSCTCPADDSRVYLAFREQESAT